LNGDGKSDFAFGASGSALEAGGPEYAGRVYVLFGGAPFKGVVDVEEVGRERPGVIIEGDEDSAGMWTQVVFTGDVNGDGFGDLLVGARSGLGYVIDGKRGAGLPRRG
jgi:hypothetical protein